MSKLHLARFGLWDAPMDWNDIFLYPDFYLENLVSDEEIERNFEYVMPPELREQFSNSENIDFDIKKEYEDVFAKGLKSKEALERSIDQHAKIVFENTEDIFDARILARELKEEIQYRIRLYSYCIMKNTKNYKNWLEEDYMRKLRLKLSQMYASVPTQ